MPGHGLNGVKGTENERILYQEQGSPQSVWQELLLPAPRAGKRVPNKE